jgi:hypothetical protein
VGVIIVIAIMLFIFNAGLLIEKHVDNFLAGCVVLFICGVGYAIGQSIFEKKNK